MNTTETSLRIRFAKALGWTQEQIDAVLKLEEIRRKYDHLPRKDSFSGLAVESEYQAQLLLCEQLNCPADRLPTIDANAVREALMGITEEEWEKLAELLYCNHILELEDMSSWSVASEVIIKTLKTPPPTLAELICEVRNVP